MRRAVLKVRVLAGVCCGLVLAGCLGGRSDTAAAGSVAVAMAVQYWPAGYVPYPPPGRNFVLHAAVTLSEGGKQLSGVDLVDGETFVCNGSSFEPDHSQQYTFLGALHDAPTLSCVYTRDGATTHFVILEPPRLRVVAPAPNSSAPVNQASILVRFAPPPTGPPMSLGAGVQDTITCMDAQSAVTAAPGSTSVLVPLPAQSVAGEHLLLVAVMTSRLPVGPTGFHSLSVTFYDRACVPLQVG